jgi:hypothetical protein
MIEFDQPIPDLKLLRRLVRVARKNQDTSPSMTDLARKRTLADLTNVGRSWQKAGLGSLVEQSSDGVRSVYFTLNDAALEVVDSADSRRLIARIGRVERSDWISLAALVISAVSAYFTYLKVGSK